MDKVRTLVVDEATHTKIKVEAAKQGITMLALVKKLLKK